MGTEARDVTGQSMGRRIPCPRSRRARRLAHRKPRRLGERDDTHTHARHTHMSPLTTAGSRYLERVTLYENSDPPSSGGREAASRERIAKLGRAGPVHICIVQGSRVHQNSNPKKRPEKALFLFCPYDSTVCTGMMS
ncbi:hypothetical protein IF1G_07780 [Cordyceps javanica]|uniref:Uncharacterized protein n=1 Tax=Cordyceps javanica TaxID=43265 RepID=A0A545UUR1_9HYPO|nr:hypothetical protein IF1G_07780 [Cordyceps javanica]